MSVEFASMPLTNATHICVGEITEREAQTLRDDGHDSDGFGAYLFLANASDLKSPVEVLAKFFDLSQANAFARLIAARA